MPGSSQSSHPEHAAQQWPHPPERNLDEDQPLQIIKQVWPCRGIKIEFPDGKSPCAEWPWEEQAELSMSWDVHIQGGILTVYAPSCSKSTTQASGQCQNCRTLQNNQRLCRIRSRINHGIAETTPYKYLSTSRLIEVLRRKDRQLDSLKLHRLNSNQKLGLLTSSNLDYRRFVMAVSECSAPRINHLVHSALRKKHGINEIIRLIGRAAMGTYKPRYTEEEHLMSVVLYRLGGARVAEFAHAALGTPGLTVTRRHCTTSILASPAFPTLDELTSNIASAYSIDAPSGSRVTGLICMVDEIKVEETLDWCSRTNSVIGLCREHSQPMAHVFNNIDDAHLIFDDLANKKVHFGTEATVAAIGALTRKHREYIARPFLISATCKGEDASKHAELLHVALRACSRKMDTTKGRVYCIASDGESRRGKALVSLTERFLLSPLSPLYVHLGGLPLLNLMVGEDEITSDKDYKHVMKRLRHTHLRTSGVSIGRVQITPAVLRSHLEANGCSIARINNLLNATDKQDVTTMLNLMQLIWSLPPPLPTDKPVLQETCIALNQHSKLLRYLILPYINIELSLYEQLKFLSAAAHLTYILFTHQNARSSFLPLPLYRDIQIMVKNVYFCVAKAKRDNPDGEFFIILLGTDRLEWIFGLIRSQNGSDVNVSTYSLSGRTSGAVECHSILSQRPEWDRGPCRLRLQGVSGGAGFEQKVDHLNPASWKGDVQVSGIQLASAWKAGRYLIESDHELAPFEPVEKLARCESSLGADLLNPFGTDAYEEVESEEILDPMPQQPQQCTSTSPMPSSLELEELVDSEHSRQNGLESTVEVADGKHVHKAKVLREFTRYTRTSNSTDRLRRVANISRFAPSFSMPNHHIGDDSITETEHILIQDVVAVLLRCEGVPFLGVAQVNSIKIDKCPQSVVSKDFLKEETVSIGIQILSLKPSNSILPNGKESNWAWNHGYDGSVTVPGKFLQQISPDLIEILEADAQKKTVGYGFRSDELRELAAMMLGTLSPEDIRKIVEIKRTDDFPYQLHSEYNRQTS
ncbi:uncharacterized protein EI90DRAFT_2928786 [Cantharellus anzutake]|uniref:uncharacterized protein n=1 Tax=Cantharellus anzutake TaxID=1750568 RepID=UPI0019067E70|nr:uncharacterized protein EI90DRAFT_2928786 [Cantharellus anzutake]KAF8327198.1 hypothetical protein EI90DRAFT_2928786 [Cantharellus anzutake]